MPTLNVCVQIYMNKRNTQNLLKLQIFLFFSEAFSVFIANFEQCFGRAICLKFKNIGYIQR